MCLCSVYEGKGRKFNLEGSKANSSAGLALVSTPSQMIKINVDVSWKVGASIGYVGIMRDLREMCIKVRRKEVQASSETVVEALAVLEGCLLAQQSNYSQIVVEFDYKQMISYLNKDAEDCS